MGHDITFHPVRVSDLRRFVFEVAADPGVGAERAAELGTDDLDVSQILDLYGHFPSWNLNVQSGQASVNQTFAFACAAVAGYRHPFWFTRGAAVGFLEDLAPELAQLFESVSSCCEPLELPPSSPLLSGNNTAGGVLPLRHFGQLREILEKLGNRPGDWATDTLHDVFGDTGLDALDRALNYAAENDLDLIEASEIVIPAAPKTYTRWANMRAHYLDKLEP